MILSKIILVFISLILPAISIAPNIVALFMVGEGIRDSVRAKRQHDNRLFRINCGFVLSVLCLLLLESVVFFIARDGFLRAFGYYDLYDTFIFVTS